MLLSAPRKHTRKCILYLVTLPENNLSKGSSVGDFWIDENPIAQCFLNQLFLNFRYFTSTKNKLRCRRLSCSPVPLEFLAGIFQNKILGNILEWFCYDSVVINFQAI